MIQSIINKFKNTYNFCVGIGVYEDIATNQKIRIKIINQIFTISMVFNLFVSPILLFLKESPNGDLIFVLSSIISSAVIFILNYKRHYTFVRILTIFYLFSVCLASHISLGNEFGVVCLHITFAQLVIFISDKKHSMLIVSLFIAQYIFANWFIITYGTLQTPPHHPLYAILYLSICSMALLLTANFFDQESIKENLKIHQQNTLIEEHNEELNRFKYIIFHDLKEPVRSIVSFSALLKRYENNPEKQREFSQFIKHSGKQLHELINGIRDFQEVDQLDIELSSVNIPSIVKDIQVVLDKMIHNKNATIVCKDIPNIKTSHYALLSVLKNLIENGIRFNDNPNPAIQIWSEVFRNRLHIYVRDNGIGIERKYFEDIFIMFKRINTDTTRSPGLGLNIARKTINKLGGELEIAYSEIDKGSTFMISFPKDVVEDDTEDKTDIKRLETALVK